MKRWESSRGDVEVDVRKRKSLWKVRKLNKKNKNKNKINHNNKKIHIKSIIPLGVRNSKKYKLKLFLVST